MFSFGEKMKKMKSLSMVIMLLILIEVSMIVMSSPVIFEAAAIPEDDPLIVEWDGIQDNYTIDVSTDSYSVIGLKGHKDYVYDDGFYLEVYDNPNHYGNPIVDTRTTMLDDVTVFGIINGHEISEDTTYYPVVK